MLTASRWLPPIRLATVPDGQALREAIDRCFARTGHVGVLPEDFKIEFIGPAVPPRTLRPRTALGLTRSPELRPEAVRMNGGHVGEYHKAITIGKSGTRAERSPEDQKAWADRVRAIGARADAALLAHGAVPGDLRRP